MSDSAAALIAELLARRGPGKTLCPSEVARALAGEHEDWRERMTEVHVAVDRLADAGAITLSWNRELLGRREGPYRISLHEWG